MTQCRRLSSQPAPHSTCQGAIRLARPVIRDVCAVSGTPGLAVGFFNRDGAVIDDYYGFRDTLAKLAPDSSTVFNIGSMCKGFTALAIACLLADGKVNWDDRIDHFLNGLPATRNGEFTIRDLLSHRTGLCRSDALFIGSDNRLLLTKGQGTDIFACLVASRPPRQDFIYNNFGYHAVGCVIEKVSSMEYGDFLAQRIFKPLNMNRTFTKLPPLSDKNVSQAYVPCSNLQLRQVPSPRISTDTVAFAAGSTRGSMTDLLTFYGALLRNFTSLVPQGVFDNLDTLFPMLTEAYLCGGIRTPFSHYAEVASTQGRSAMDRVQEMLDKERIPSDPPDDLDQYTGIFWHKTGHFRIVVRADKNAGENELVMSLQGQDDEGYTLRHYGHDTFLFNETFDQTVHRGQWSIVVHDEFVKFLITPDGSISFSKHNYCIADCREMNSIDNEVIRVQYRLHAILPTISLLHEVTGAASVSSGVLNRGKVVLQGNEGWRDAVVGECATIHDALSHTTGLAQLDFSWYSASSKNLVEPQDLLHVVASLPIAAQFRKEWSYCSHLHRSKLWRDAFNDGNVATPHYVKDDRSPGVLQWRDLCAETLMGRAGCLWPTVPDMLRWVRAVLSSIDPNKEAQIDDSPLREMSTITAHHAELTHQELFENTYGYGWSRLSMPSPMYGFMSTNGMNEEAIPGRGSSRRLMLYHGGQSAIIVLGNAQAIGDAPDWTARATMQALNIYSGLMNDYNLNKGHEVPQGELHDKLGKYSNDGLKLYLNICATDRRDKIGEFLLNGMETQRHYLEHFRDSTFGFPPDCREEQECRCMVDYVVYEQLLLTFKEDGSGKYDRLEWVMQPGLPAIIFKREA
ncbi:hypothetical protein SUNI508_00338 [Seiridium unicorne]|uniref:Beta-lactamase-related domain-containing protein n=1 Tax=Seiridium unicorne TaxID=138068 RepID=A0ABR2VJ53_9PEZI